MERSCSLRCFPLAKENCNSNSLVIICDNHRRNSVECQEIMDIAKNIVVIDHHRRSSDYIKETSLTYLEPYASSASEMVTEVLFYMTEKLEIKEGEKIYERSANKDK